MDDPYAVGRRGFLKTGATAAAAAAVACGSPRSRWRALSENEAATLGAACDRIIPPDRDPGAAEAGVVDFIDRQLATREKRNLGKWQSGVRSLNATARRRHGKTFTELDTDTRTSLLQAIEQGSVEKADWQEMEATEFFRTLHSYTMMGFYGDPRHGGNKNRVSWRMLGVPDPPIRGRLHETPPPPALAKRAVQAAPRPRSAARKG